VGEIPNSKSQIPNKEVPCGHIINASGDINCTCHLINPNPVKGY
jgi:hypothetical protein